MCDPFWPDSDLDETLDAFRVIDDRREDARQELRHRVDAYRLNSAIASSLPKASKRGERLRAMAKDAPDLSESQREELRQRAKAADEANARGRLRFHGIMTATIEGKKGPRYESVRLNTVLSLAELWLKYHGRPPGYTTDPDDGNKVKGPFPHFVESFFKLAESDPRRRKCVAFIKQACQAVSHHIHADAE